VGGKRSHCLFGLFGSLNSLIPAAHSLFDEMLRCSVATGNWVKGP
jgi:hypothetical protein